MAEIPTTSTTLLRDLAQDSQHVRWREFAAKYRPMMEAFLRERFPSVEVDDVIQETLVALCGILPGYVYEPDEKGHFRAPLPFRIRIRQGDTPTAQGCVSGVVPVGRVFRADRRSALS